MSEFRAKELEVVYAGYCSAFFFVFGLLAGLVKSELKLPSALYDSLSVFLLIAIGLKGGQGLAQQSVFFSGTAASGGHYIRHYSDTDRIFHSQVFMPFRPG